MHSILRRSNPSLLIIILCKSSSSSTTESQMFSTSKESVNSSGSFWYWCKTEVLKSSIQCGLCFLLLWLWKVCLIITAFKDTRHSFKYLEMVTNVLKIVFFIVKTAWITHYVCEGKEVAWLGCLWVLPGQMCPKCTPCPKRARTWWRQGMDWFRPQCPCCNLLCFKTSNRFDVVKLHTLHCQFIFILWLR